MTQLESMRGGEQVEARLAQHPNKYLPAVGPLARRAAEALVQRQGARTNGRAVEAREVGEQRTLANVYVDPKHHTVTLLLDDATAATVIYAVRLLAADSEAHAREVRVVRDRLPSDSYGAANRQVIASRHERIATRLRMLEGKYREVVN